MFFDTLLFILNKKKGLPHSPEEISNFVHLAVKGEIPDYQISAWLMAVCFQGLTFRETLALTEAMATSGKVLSWEDGGPPVVDKHSTGGVGDTATLIVVPLVAAMGMRIGKHSGRGLGHTGGTIDKLESIPGFNTNLSEAKLRKIVNKVGCAIASQSKNMTPADALLYSIRDVTGTVDQESLIAASIISKKLAGGAKTILLDVKVGSGAFMKDIERAKTLAKLMIKLGKACGRNVKALLTNMDAPLGRSIGNALEVIEAIKVLRCEVPPNDPLRILSIEIAAQLAAMCGISNLDKARQEAEKALENGEALERFRGMVKLQGGDPKVVENPEEILPRARKVLKLRSPADGFIKRIDALAAGELVRDLGGGRKTKTDKIDHAVGIVLCKRRGEALEKGEVLCEIHSNGALSDEEALSRAHKCFTFSKTKPSSLPLIISRL